MDEPTTLTMERMYAAALFRLAQRGHGVERFAGLADDDDERPIVHDGIAVAELGREHDLDVAAQQMLQIILADHADVVATSRRQR